MEQPDQTLLQRFVCHSDNAALTAIIHRYASMVFGTCHRVLGNEAQAADVVQETFYQLVKSAHRITGSLGSWLHQVATRRSIDLVRENTSRRRREEAYAADHLEAREPWRQIEPLVDEALEEIPADLRELLVLHYLEQKTMCEIAKAQGLSQPTVSRRIAVALEQLRHNLRARGVVVELTILGTLLANSAKAAPASLLHALGKISLAQAATASTGASASQSAISWIGLKTAAAILALSLSGGTGWLLCHRPSSHSPSSQQSQPSSVQTSAPIPPTEVKTPPSATDYAAVPGEITRPLPGLPATTNPASSKPLSVPVTGFGPQPTGPVPQIPPGPNYGSRGRISRRQFGSQIGPYSGSGGGGGGFAGGGGGGSITMGGGAGGSAGFGGTAGAGGGAGFSAGGSGGTSGGGGAVVGGFGGGSIGGTGTVSGPAFGFPGVPAGGPQSFSTNYGFSHSVIIENGVVRETRSEFSSGQTRDSAHPHLSETAAKTTNSPNAQGLPPPSGIGKLQQDLRAKQRAK
ncbi:MAG TPA: sigma-70 family RNA polymerase sigma factor [Candidatus Paceibacterota bacterium]|nr:sigma-70 family RNA polymerase sigma factor [Verrucomicrobiota bacterium]HRY50099.1 sigma-70 family RNA polymerase sigma factor [Candidatus Paceibacterota bacterium]HSA00718.1 sigma-70 family RNA polymerase sigma factor [Candidatus Paceibacterota bacterium]